ncbi:MAG: MFS transporter [Clostridia bacterium]|nr:MFS transporter [Clostridia bacterium]
MKFNFNLITQYKGLRKEIYVLCVGRIVTSLGSMIWPMLTLVMSQKMGFDASDISIYMVVGSLIMMPANLIGGKLADRVNKRRLIIYCDIVSIICYIICGIIPLSITTIVIIIFAGIFQNMEGPAYYSLTSDFSEVKDRERAYSLGYLCMNLGMVLAPTLGGILFKEHIGLMFIINGVSIGVSTLLIFTLIKDITPVEDLSEEAEYQNSKSEKGILSVIKNNKTVFLFLVIISIYYSSYGQWGYLMPLDMGMAHGEDGAVIYGTVSSLNCIIVVVFTPIITKLFKKFTEANKLLTGELLLGAGFALFITMLGNIPIYYVAIFFFTLGEIFSTIAEGPYVSRRIPASHRGRINGISSVLGTLISGATDLTVGHVYDSSGSGIAWAVVISLLGLAAVLTVVLGRIDRKKYPKLYKKSGSEEETEE